MLQGTYLEGRLSLQSADDLLAKGDVGAALGLLKKVQPDQHHYYEAVKFMAEIYFSHKNDPMAYTDCFL
jgi:Tfp pilus assembly protein PilF